MLTQARPGQTGGFTLIEMVVTVAIVGILLAIGASSYQTWIENSKTRTAAESLVSGLNLARSNAILLNTTVAFNLTALPASTWSVSPLTCPNGATTCVIESRQSSEGSGPAASATVNGVTVTSSDTATSIQFNNLGRMVAPVPGNGTYTSLDVANTRISTNDNRNLRVTVDIGGSIRMCDPSVTVATDPRICPP